MSFLSLRNHEYSRDWNVKGADSGEPSRLFERSSHVDWLTREASALRDGVHVCNRHNAHRICNETKELRNDSGARKVERSMEVTGGDSK